MDDVEKLDTLALAMLFATRHSAAQPWRCIDQAIVHRLVSRGLINKEVLENDVALDSSAALLTPEGLELAEAFFYSELALERTESWRALRDYPDTQVRAADGVRGDICRDHANGSAFFREYHGGGEFTDYDIRHDDLSVVILIKAMASFYRKGDAHYLDHSPQVLGIVS